MSRFIYPLSAPITQNFGQNAWDYSQVGQIGHNGIDFGAQTGTPVKASGDGTIFFEGWGQNSSWMGQPAGICVLINHGDVFTGYAHLKNTIVSKGQKVVQGQLIGYSDSTGAATGPHLHFETIPGSPNWNNGYAGRVNPSNYGLTKEGDEEVKINSSSDWRWRFNRLHRQIVGNWDMSDDVFKSIVGQDAWKVVESWSDHSNANLALEQQLQGETAIKDNWPGQIKERTRERDEARSEAEKLKKALNEKPTEIIVEKPVEVIKEVANVDKLSLGELIQAAYKKLFKIK